MNKAPATLPTDCDDATGLLSVDEAHRRIHAGVAAISDNEMVTLHDALGRVLAADIVSPIDVPAHTNSAMDGYAVAAADLPAAHPAELRVVGTAWAGRPLNAAVGRGECARIMTGAPMPSGTDTVIMQENVEVTAGSIRIRPGHRPGDNVRAAGEDLARGALALERGRRLAPADLGLLASIGVAPVPVFRRLRVSFFSTGDELRSVGETLGPGEIYDSNRYTLNGMLMRLGVEIRDLGVVRDDRAAVRAAFRDAATGADAVITSGGVSVGEADFVKETLEELGAVGFWKIAMKPGRPLAFGRIGSAAFFGLPGNPVSVMVTFYQFVQPALRRMMGEHGPFDIPTVRVRTAGRFRKRPGRTEYQRAVLERGADGELSVRSVGDQGSGILSSMTRADCFVVLPGDSNGVEAGTMVDVQLFHGII